MFTFIFNIQVYEKKKKRKQIAKSTFLYLRHCLSYLKWALLQRVFYTPARETPVNNFYLFISDLGLRFWHKCSVFWKWNVFEPFLENADLYVLFRGITAGINRTNGIRSKGVEELCKSSTKGTPRRIKNEIGFIQHYNYKQPQNDFGFEN